MSYQPTVVFDFDGVVSEYKKGWEGAMVINDLPTPGIKEAICRVRKEGYKVVIVSSRCALPEGIAAVEDFLEKYEIEVDGVESLKPPALCYVDDRAICFDGDAAGLIKKVLNFKPWTETPVSYWEIHTEHFSPWRRCSSCGFEMPLIANCSKDDRIVFKHCPECTSMMKGELIL